MPGFLLCLGQSCVFWISLFLISLVRSLLPQENPGIDLSQHWPVVKESFLMVNLELLAVYGVAMLCYGLLFYGLSGCWGRSGPGLSRSWRYHGLYLLLTLFLFYAHMAVRSPALVEDFILYEGVIFNETLLDFFALKVPLSLVQGFQWLLLWGVPLGGLIRRIFDHRQKIPLGPLLGGLLLVALLLGSFSFLGERDHPLASGKRHLILIGVDSLRPDHLSFSGYPRKTSPHLDEFFKESLFFENMMTPLPRTAPSWMSLLTGLKPQEHGLTHMFPREEQRRVPPTHLISLWKQYHGPTYLVSDYAGEMFGLFPFHFDVEDRPEGFSLFSLVSRHVLYKHFAAISLFNKFIPQHFISSLQFLPINADPQWITYRAIRQLEKIRTGEKASLLLINYSAVHSPGTILYPHTRWLRDPKYKGPNRYAYAVRDVKDIELHGGEAFTPQDQDEAIKNYDRSIRTVDAAIGRLFDYLKEHGLYEHSDIIVLSDHGETLFERGHPLIHGAIFDGGLQDIRTTFAWKRGGQARPLPSQRIQPLTRFIDVLPTLGREFFPAVNIPGTGVDLLAKVSDAGEVQIPPLELYVENGVLVNSAVDYEFLKAKTYPMILKLLGADQTFPGYIYLKKEYEGLVASAKWRLHLSSDFKQTLYAPSPTQGRFYRILGPGQLQQLDPQEQTQELSPLKKAILEYGHFEFNERYELQLRSTFP